MNKVPAEKKKKKKWRRNMFHNKSTVDARPSYN